MYSNIALKTVLRKTWHFFYHLYSMFKKRRRKDFRNYMRKHVELYNLNCKGPLCNFSFYSERSQDSKRLNDLSKITYLINGKARNRFHISWFPSNTISIKWNWLLVISGELKIKPIIYELFQLSTPQLYISLFLYSSLTVFKKRITFSSI